MMCDHSDEMMGKRPTWTSRKPTEPGWYLWRKPALKGGWYERVVQVGFVGNDLWWNDVRPVSEEIGEWAGTMEPPEEE